MALLKLKRDAATSSRAKEVTQETARQLRARSKYFAHLAAAQGYRAAANSQGMMTQSGGYLRRKPLASAGIVAAIAGLIGLGMYRRKKS
jgi:ElaB/YqjD/DUF883 family membrane-anchored ribosome-binding protein